MRRRRVVVTLEMDTDIPLSWLRSRTWWSANMDTTVKQAQANVVRVKEKK